MHSPSGDHSCRPHGGTLSRGASEGEGGWAVQAEGCGAALTAKSVSHVVLALIVFSMPLTASTGRWGWHCTALATSSSLANTLHTTAAPAQRSAADIQHGTFVSAARSGSAAAAAACPSTRPTAVTPQTPIHTAPPRTGCTAPRRRQTQTRGRRRCPPPPARRRRYSSNQRKESNRTRASEPSFSALADSPRMFKQSRTGI